MIVKINGQPVAGEIITPITEGILQKSNSAIEHVVYNLIHDFTITLVSMAPDLLIVLGMIGCIGLIMNVKRSGKFIVTSLIGAIVAEAIKLGVGA